MTNRQRKARAVLWSAGTTRFVGSLPRRPFSEAVAINDRGQVVGYSSAAPLESDQAQKRAFLWQRGKTTDLGVLPGTRESWPVAINERGQIVGMGGDGDRAFLWQNGKMTALKPAPSSGDRFTEVAA